MQLDLSYDSNKNSWSARKDGHLFVLCNRHAPDAASTIETDGHVIRRKKLSGNYMIVQRLGKHPKGWLIEPVTDNHVLCTHEGFETVGSMCSTQSVTTGVLVGNKDDKRFYTNKRITPGRVFEILRVVNNVNPNWPRPVYADELTEGVYNDPRFAPKVADDVGVVGYFTTGYLPTIPGQIWITRGETRGCGIERIEDLDGVAA